VCPSKATTPATINAANATAATSNRRSTSNRGDGCRQRSLDFALLLTGAEYAGYGSFGELPGQARD